MEFVRVWFQCGERVGVGLFLCCVGVVWCEWDFDFDVVVFGCFFDGGRVGEDDQVGE